MSKFPHLTKPAAAALRAAFRDEARVTTATLLERLAAMGYKSSNYRYNILSDAFALGMVDRRRTGYAGFVYSLTPDWGWPEVAVARTPRPEASHPARTGRPLRSLPTPAAAYVGPAFGSAALAPSVGTNSAALHLDGDGEVTPYHGGQILDALQRQFDSVFRNVE